MFLEQFLRDHMTEKKKDFVLTVAVDPNTQKLTAKFHDDEKGGSEANVRIEGNTVILQSFDLAQDKKGRAEREAEEKKKAAEAERDRAETKRRLSGQSDK